MRRWLPILSIALGLLGCAAAVTLWHSNLGKFRSNFFEGYFDGDREWRGYYLATTDGQLAFELERILFSTRPADPPTNRWRAEDAVGLRTPALRSLPFDGPLGFHYVNEYTIGPSGTLHTLRISFPWWAVLLPSLPPLLLGVRSLLRRRRRIRSRICLRCGYDLRASPDRCPECGEHPPGRSTACVSECGYGTPTSNPAAHAGA